MKWFKKLFKKGKTIIPVTNIAVETEAMRQYKLIIKNLSETEKKILIFVNYNPFIGSSYYTKEDIIKEAKIDPEKAEEALKSLIEKDMAYTKIMEYNLLPGNPKETVYCFKSGMWEDGGFISDLYALKAERLAGTVCP